MPDASLPDRVEAARALHRMLLDNDDATIDISQGVLRRIIGGALAAADACEAERNPNRQLPHKFPSNAPDEVIAWRCAACGQWSDIHGEFDAPCSIDWRRPVSSEDVHREAAE